MATQLLLETHLRTLRLPTFNENYQTFAQEAARQNLPYERYLLGLAKEEVERRERNTVARMINAAHFPTIKELADFDFAAVPELARARVLDLAQGGYIAKAEPILLVGNPGLGKSHVATGLALAACRQGKRVRFYNAAGLVNDLSAAQAEYRLSRVMNQMLKYQLIVLDELGFIPFTNTGAQLLFQFCTQLYERVAVIVTTNLGFAQWSSIMGGDERMSAALLDRLTHRAHILEFIGTSYRFREQLSRGVDPSKKESVNLERVELDDSEDFRFDSKDGESENSAPASQAAEID